MGIKSKKKKGSMSKIKEERRSAGITLYLPEDLAKAVNNHCNETGVVRNFFIVKAVEKYAESLGIYKKKPKDGESA